MFLDELPEFSHTALESLRQPLEDKVVTISRVAGTVTYPASFMLVAAMNPCPCGYNTDPKKECSCSPSAVARYQKRVSGPLLDRIDVFVEVPPVEYEKLMEEEPGENSNHTRRNVEQAREVQQERFREQGVPVQLGNGGQRMFGNRAPWTKAPGRCSRRRPSVSTCRPGPSTAS